MTTPRKHLVNPIITRNGSSRGDQIDQILKCKLLYTNIILKFMYFLCLNRYNADAEGEPRCRRR